MAARNNFGRFHARRALPLALGGVVLALVGFLTGLTVGGNEEEPAKRSVAPTTTRQLERVLGRASGGGNGTGTTTIGFHVNGSWRIDHHVEGDDATITVTDSAGGYSFTYMAPAGSGSRGFDRTCQCRVSVSSPDGTFSATIVDTADQSQPS